MQRGVAYGKEAPLCPLECDFHSMVAYIPIGSFFRRRFWGPDGDLFSFVSAAIVAQELALTARNALVIAAPCGAE